MTPKKKIEKIVSYKDDFVWKAVWKAGGISAYMDEEKVEMLRKKINEIVDLLNEED